MLTVESGEYGQGEVNGEVWDSSAMTFPPAGPTTQLSFLDPSDGVEFET